jgi:hypothetical protein
MASTPAERSLQARHARFVQWSRHDPKVVTAPGRAAFLSRFEDEVRAANPNLAPAEVARRAEYARKAYFAQLALKSAKARRARKAGAR